jgi:hypothetical protein
MCYLSLRLPAAAKKMSNILTTPCIKCKCVMFASLSDSDSSLVFFFLITLINLHNKIKLHQCIKQFALCDGLFGA